MSDDLNIKGQFNKHFQLCGKVLTLIDRMIGGKNIPHNNEPLKLLTLFVATKTIKTFKAIILLAEDGYGEDASVLLRTILSQLLILQYVLIENSENRAREFFAHSVVAAEGDLQTSCKWLGSDHPDMMSEEERKELKASAAKMKEEFELSSKRSPWKGKKPLDMALEIDRAKGNKDMEWNYDYVYQLLSDIEHSNSSILHYYLVKTNNGWLAKPLPSDNLVEASIGTAAGYLLLVMKEVNSTFSLGFASEIDELLLEAQLLSQ